MRLLLAILIVPLFAGCYYDDDIPPDQSVWDYALPSRHNISDDALLQLDQEISSGLYGNINSLIIIKNDQLIFENYYNNDNRSTQHNVGQVANGWISAVFGKVLEDQLNDQLDIPIYGYLTEYQDIFEEDTLKKTITIRHVLEMRSGLSWNEIIKVNTELDSDMRMTMESDDPIRYILEKPLESFPGVRFSFNSASSLLLIRIMESIVGESAENYLNNSLFNQIGINPNYAKLKNGTLNIPMGVSVTALDAAKLNYLIMKNGDWFGEQILSSDWIERSTSIIVAPNNNSAYGYFWRTFGPESFVASNYNIDDTIYLTGDSHQAVYFSRSSNLLICINADNPPNGSSNLPLSLFLRVLASRNVEL